MKKIVTSDLLKRKSKDVTEKEFQIPFFYEDSYYYYLIEFIKTLQLINDFHSSRAANDVTT